MNFDACLKDSLTAVELKAIEGIVSRYDHLRKNVKHIEFGSYNSGRGSDGIHHRMILKLSVDTSSL